MTTSDARAHATIERLWERWWQAWNEERYDLLRECMTEPYTQHGPTGAVQVTREQLVQQMRQMGTQYHVHIHAHGIVGDQVWSRATYARTDATTGQPSTRAVLQVHRVEGGQFAETWFAAHPDGSAWPEYQAGLP